jgi:hypothetical protein
METELFAAEFADKTGHGTYKSGPFKRNVA